MHFHILVDDVNVDLIGSSFLGTAGQPKRKPARGGRELPKFEPAASDTPPLQRLQIASETEEPAASSHGLTSCV